jgi:hypothetical protein
MATRLNTQMDFTTLVRRWDQRSRLQQMLGWLPRTLILGVLLGLVLAVISRMRPFLTDMQVLLATVVAGIGFSLVMALGIWLWRRSTITSARRFDREFGLKERVSTAIELLEGKIRADTILADHQMSDAYTHASQIHHTTLLPLKPVWREWGLLGGMVAALLIMLLLIPAVNAQDLSGQNQQVAIDSAADEVKDIIEAVSADTTLTEEQRQPLLEALQENLETLNDEQITPEEAYASLEDVEAQLQEQADQLETEADAQQSALNEANTQLQSSAGVPPAEGQETFSESLDSLSQRLESMTPEERQQAADALEQAADAMQETNPEMAQALRDAAQALRDGDLDEAQEKLDEAAQQAQQQETQAQQQQQSAENMTNSAAQAGQAAQQIAQGGQQSNSQNSDQSQAGAQQPGDQSSNSGGQQPNQTGDQAGSQGDQPGSQGSGQQEGENSQGSQSSTSGTGKEGGSAPGDGAPSTGAGLDNSQGTGGNSSEGSDGQSGGGAGNAEGDLGQNSTGGSRDPNASANNEPDGSGVREYEPIFAPNSIDSEGNGEEIQLDTSEGDQPLTDGEFQENPTGNTMVPYNEVFSNYADAASRALNQDYIPLGLRDVIRDYFSSLDPNQ